MTVVTPQPPTVSVPTQPAAPPTPPRSRALRRFSVVEYRRLIQDGLLTEGEPIELLEGWIVHKMTRNPPHDVAPGLAGDAIAGRLPAGWHVREQAAITTADSEPEPDLAVARGVRRDYKIRHPGPTDLALVVEIAESSLADDRDIKNRIYARAGIAVYWIVNPVRGQVEVYTDPTGPDPNPVYRRRDDFGPNDAVSFAIPGHPATQIPVHELLP